MTQEQLERGNKILEEIGKTSIILKAAKYMLSENVIERKSFLSFNGIEGQIEIPECLFRTIGKLIESEMILKQNVLNKEFNEL